MGRSFKDHFSDQAPDYVRFRPAYPDALFAWLARNTAVPGTAWDCGTGSGQAALGLAAHFERVVATDPSASQLAHAPAHPNIEYRCLPAEAPELEDRSIDLITVAQAIHWFDLDRFYAVARRVLKPGGLIAAWTYTLLDVEAGIDALVSDYYRNVVGPFWPPERKLVDDRYRSLPFPFDPVVAPPFEIRTEWSQAELLGYLGTWSATRAFIKAKGIDPLAELGQRLAALWPDPETQKALRWPLHLRVGRA